MQINRHRALVTGLFLTAMALVAGSGFGREDIVYVSQFIILSIGLIVTRRNIPFQASVGFLLAADLMYYLLVYKLEFGTENKYVVFLSSSFYFASFNFFTYSLIKNSGREFIRIALKKAELPIALFFIGVAAFYIFVPGLQKLLTEGFSFGHISNLITLLSSLPLAITSYIFLTNGPIKKPQAPIIGFFILAILDIGIQLETIKYGDLKFSMYDLLWFFGVYLIALSAKEFSQSKTALIERASIINLIKKVFFVSALAPLIVFFVLTQDQLALSPMYFIFIVISIFLFGITLSGLIFRRIGHYNDLVHKILSTETKIKVETVVENTPIEFQESIFAVINRSIESDINELRTHKDSLLEMKTVYRKMAHDLASPLSVLEIISKVSQDFDEDKRSLLLSATQRVRSVADDILLRGRSTAKKYEKSFSTLSCHEIKSTIDSLVKEKNLEFQNKRSSVKFNCHSALTGNLKVLGEQSGLSRILSNLLNNSMEALGNSKYGKIQINLNEDSEWLCIEISDNGPGFPKEVLNHNFVSPISLKRSGHGIGLFTASKMIQKWQGNLKIQNDQGAKIVIVLKYLTEEPHNEFVALNTETKMPATFLNE